MTTATYSGSTTKVALGCIPARMLPPKEMPARQLVSLLRAISTMMDVAAGISCQPNMTDGRSYNRPPGVEFDKISNFLSDCYLDVLERLRSSTTSCESEQEDRRAELLKHDLGCDQDVTDIALAAVSRAFPGKF